MDIKRLRELSGMQQNESVEPIRVAVADLSDNLRSSAERFEEIGEEIGFDEVEIYEISQKIHMISSEIEEAVMTRRNTNEAEIDPIEYKYYRGPDVLVMTVGHSYTVVLHPEHLDQINQLEDGETITIRIESGDRVKVKLDNGHLHMTPPSISYGKTIVAPLDHVMRKAGRRH